MKLKGKPNAFSMVEVALALGIASFCLLVLFALIPVGLSSKKETIQYTVAASIASEVASDLRSTRITPTAATSGRFQLIIPVAGTASTMTSSPQSFYMSSDGTPSATMVAGSNPSMYRVSVGFAPPASGKTSTQVRIMVTWPAQSYPNKTVWPGNLGDSYEVMTSLDRS